MTTYEHVLFEAWIHGMITDNEFALAWELNRCQQKQQSYE